MVTGAAGFIGSNLVKALNARGETDIIAVDDLTQGDKFRNLADCEIADYVDKDEFLMRVGNGDFDDDIATVFHQGAILVEGKTEQVLGDPRVREVYLGTRAR